MLDQTWTRAPADRRSNTNDGSVYDPCGKQTKGHSLEILGEWKLNTSLLTVPAICQLIYRVTGV